MYVPSYANPNPTFQPAMRVLAGITNAFPMEVTTTFAHQYHNGLIVRLDIPVGLGMPQANQITGTVTVTGSTTFTLPIDSTNFDPFVVPSAFPPPYQDGQVVPIGEVNELLSLATQNVLPLP